MKMFKILAMAFVLGLFLVSCGQPKTPAEKAKEKVEQMKNDAKDAMEDAKESVKDAADDATDKVSEAVEDIKDGADDTAKKVKKDLK